MSAKKLLRYPLFILAALAAGGLSALLSMEGMKAFEALAKPALTPPRIVFPIVWTVLYILMGVSAAMAANAPVRRGSRESALRLWWIQLLFNFLWSIFFFRFEARGFSFFWLLALLVLVAAMTERLWRVSRTAALLQIPYILWLILAGYLNLGVWLLN